MKASVLLPCFLLLSLSANTPGMTNESDIAMGDSIERVYSLLGQPQGYIRCGSFELLTYDRGKVAIKDGLVTELELVSPEEAEAMRREREQQLEARRLATAEHREKMQTEGRALKKATLGNPAFFALSAREQVEFWESFRKHYPDVPVETEYGEALTRRREEIDRERIRQELRELEMRLALAEERARDAERAAERADRRDGVRTYVYYPPASFRYYTPYRSDCMPTPYHPSTVGPFGNTAFPPSSPSYIWRSHTSDGGLSGTVYYSGSSKSSSGIRVNASF